MLSEKYNYGIYNGSKKEWSYEGRMSYLRCTAEIFGK